MDGSTLIFFEYALFRPSQQGAPGGTQPWLCKKSTNMVHFQHEVCLELSRDKQGSRPLAPLPGG